MKLAIDAMGGDHAPKAIVEGAMLAIEKLNDLHITLIGDETKIKSFLTNNKNITIIHTDEVIEGSEEPVRAVRRKKNASMVLMANEVKEGNADACISAGNTGALMTAGLLVVGRMEGVERPALSPTMPTLDGKGFVFLDVGANVDAKASHLLQYAIMGSVYAEQVRGIKNPTIGLLNVGTEDKKGNELAKQTFQLLKESNLNFIGNVEARDLMNSVADVVVTDGYTGNVALKAIEGTALAMFSLIKDAMLTNFTSKLAAAVLKPNLKGVKKKMDYAEYGGAALFGLKSPVIKAHGSSDAQGIYSAIKQAKTMVEHNVVKLVSDHMEKNNESNA